MLLVLEILVTLCAGITGNKSLRGPKERTMEKMNTAFQLVSILLSLPLYMILSTKCFLVQSTPKKVMKYLALSPQALFIYSVMIALVVELCLHIENSVVQGAVNNLILFALSLLTNKLYAKLAEQREGISAFIYHSIILSWLIVLVVSSDSVIYSLCFLILVPGIFYILFYKLIYKEILRVNSNRWSNQYFLLNFVPIILEIIVYLLINFSDLYYIIGNNDSKIFNIGYGVINFFCTLFSYLLLAVIIIVSYIVLKSLQQDETITSLNKNLLQNQEDITIAFAKVTEGRSKETGEHVKRVAAYTTILLRHIGYEEGMIHDISMASMLHDIGKIAIPDSILNKAGPLTPEEYDIVKTHVALGHDMISEIHGNMLKYAQTIILQHHEKWNGKGYLGLKGEEIDMISRVVTVADVYDAMGSKRVYKDAWAEEDIYRTILEECGSSFDPFIVEVFKECYPEILETKKQLLSS